MQLKIPEKFRLFVSKKYLDWVEKLPRFRGGFISHLQLIREYQRKDSERTYQSTRPPKGTEIEYLYFCLIEIFHVEDFNELLKGLFSLFPTFQNTDNFRNFVKDFRDLSEDIYKGGTIRIGIIDRKNERKFTLPEVIYREIKNLPEEVKYIEVVLHKFLPSLIAITFRVYLNPKTTQYLLNQQSKHYLSNIRLSNLRPWKLYLGGYSQDNTDNVMTNQIVGSFNRLQAQVENCISHFFKGYFLKQAINYGKTKLPAIEVYGLKGLPEDPESFKNWLKDARRWWQSLGFQLNFDVYTDYKFLLSNINKSSWLSDEDTGYRFVVLWEQFIKSIDVKAYGNEERGAILHDTFFVLNEIIPLLAISEYIKSARKNFEKLRKIIFSSMKYSNWSIFMLDRYFKLDRVMKQEYIRLERLSMEFGQSKKFLLREAEDFKELKAVSSEHAQKEENFRDVIFKSINFNMNFLKKHFQLIKNSFSDHLAIENMKAIFILTIITATLTFLAFINNWTAIKSLFTLAIKQVKMMTLLIFEK